MGPIVNKARNVILGHFGKLLLENAFQAGEDNEAIMGAIVVDNSEFDITAAFF
jgi:hypothetical protein